MHHTICLIQFFLFGKREKEREKKKWRMATLWLETIDAADKLTGSFLTEFSGVHDTGSGHASVDPTSLWCPGPDLNPGGLHQLPSASPHLHPNRGYVVIVHLPVYSTGHFESHSMHTLVQPNLMCAHFPISSSIHWPWFLFIIYHLASFRQHRLH